MKSKKEEIAERITKLKSRKEDIMNTGIARKILRTLRNNPRTFSCTGLGKELNITYQHMVKILRRLQERKLITMELNGREFKIHLIEKGVFVADHLIKIEEILKD